MNEEITERQRLAISLIEKNLPGIKFVGSTKRDASEFIGTYMERSVAVHNKRMIHTSKKSYRPATPPHIDELDNEAAVKIFCQRIYEDKLLVMPDMAVAYIPEDWE